ncbi:OsmC family protein [Hydrogenophaga laconesensis]|uniref:OsmC-like protein n=1 Tax=Hydrogenophaga laconesensis TaxID=1805971 RepID=A0ABU1VA55_9BURK|nr:OsmC family protein [Hydrogenophaga laconesensis]MDR7094351.1 putative OsmC-like protein [Hydrogenophaga laconesensis]
MNISATVRHNAARYDVEVRTGATAQALIVPAKTSGEGSAVSGGEFLVLALATCYCNDLYREARRLRIPIDGVEVQASARFAGIGLAATDIRYTASVNSPASPEAISALLRETDAVAEVQNTLRKGVPVVRQSAS